MIQFPSFPRLSSKFKIKTNVLKNLNGKGNPDVSILIGRPCPHRACKAIFIITLQVLITYICMYHGFDLNFDYGLKIVWIRLT